MNNGKRESDDADELKGALRAHLDAAMLTPRELDADLALLLARKQRRRSLVAHVALPGVLAAAAVVVFAMVRAPAPAPAEINDDAVHIYIAESGDPESAIVIDFVMNNNSQEKQ